jgi:hypothetical protein
MARLKMDAFLEVDPAVQFFCALVLCWLAFAFVVFCFDHRSRDPERDNYADKLPPPRTSNGVPDA